MAKSRPTLTLPPRQPTREATQPSNPKAPYIKGESTNIRTTLNKARKAAGLKNPKASS